MSIAMLTRERLDCTRMLPLPITTMLREFTAEAAVGVCTRTLDDGTVAQPAARSRRARQKGMMSRMFALVLDVFLGVWLLLMTASLEIAFVSL